MMQIRLMIALVVTAGFGLMGAGLWWQDRKIDALIVERTLLQSALAGCRAGNRIAKEEKDREEDIDDKPFGDLFDPDWLLPSPEGNGR